MSTALHKLAARLRVLHVIPTMAVEGGGPPRICAGLAGATSELGHGVTIATLAQEGLTPAEVNAAVEIHAFTPDIPPYGGRYGKSRELDAWLRGNVRNFDIVHLHSIWQFPTFAAARACWSGRVPYVVLLNGMLDRYSVEQRSRWTKRGYWLLREGRIQGRAAGLQMGNLAEIRRAMPWIRRMPKFIAGNGIDQERMASIPPRGLFRAEHAEFRGKKLALFLSRLHPKKGLDRLIPAWKDVAQVVPESVLVVAGCGDWGYEAALKALVKEHGLEEKVKFLGQVAGEEKWKLLADADVFVLPSHQEGFSMAITEALATGCTPVVTEECNFDELEGGGERCGVIVRGGDMKRFAGDTAELLSPHGTMEREQMAEAGKRLVAQRFTWQRIAADVEQVYRHILAGKSLAANAAEVWRGGESPAPEPMTGGAGRKVRPSRVRTSMGG